MEDLNRCRSFDAQLLADTSKYFSNFATVVFDKKKTVLVMVNQQNQSNHRN
jgi:hypothetical protein